MLFSERYRDKIGYGAGEPVDHICEDVSQKVKCELSGVMHDFAEPAVIYPNRYDSYDVRTTALEIAVRAFVNSARTSPPARGFRSTAAAKQVHRHGGEVHYQREFLYNGFGTRERD